MKPDILEVQPQELKFLFELKKQSTCSIQMINKTDHYVAFKVKTTNPKKYCVRPNTGVIDPNSACEFSVTMQAPKVVPPDMICRDKFLVQGTYVPEGTKEEDVTSNMFVRDDGKVVDEKRLKVILVPPPDSPESSPINGESKLVLKDEGNELKEDIVQKHSPHVKIDEGMEMSKGGDRSLEVIRKEEPMKKKEETVKRNEESVTKQPNKEYIKRNEDNKEFIKRSEESIQMNVQMNDMEVVRLAKDVDEMKLKVKELESNLHEAKATIVHLTEEKRSATQEKHFLQGELDLLRSKRHRAQVGFPLLFVFMVALVSLYFGYLLHP